MVIQHNMSAFNSQRTLNITGGKLEKVNEKLSSGYRINRSADDAAGLAISEKMRRQIRGLTQASYNAQDGISLCQTAEGALHEAHDMLQRMNELSIKASNGTMTDEERAYLQAEVSQIKGEFDRIANSTRFNEIVLLNGSKEQITGVVTPKSQVKIDFSSMNVTTMYSVKADQTGMYTTSGGSEQLKNLLKEEIVPRAVDAILDTLPETFGYLRDSEIGIGLEFKEDFNDSVLAYVSAGTFVDRMFYTLSVNTAYYTGTEESRTELERTIAHEMMHALMSEALTAGMTGTDHNDNSITGFPSWFVEGTAQLISGAFESNNNWITAGLLLNKNNTTDEVEARLNQHRLGSGTSASEYGTGYLAVMYLGHIISDSHTISGTSIADGVDALLNTIRGGASLNRAISELTDYTGLQDYMDNFSKDAADFTLQLMDKVEGGTGSILGGNLTEEDLLENGINTDATVEKLFSLNTSNTIVLNDYSVYDPNHIMMEGGALWDDGVEGKDYVPSTIDNADSGNTDGSGDGNVTDPDDTTGGNSNVTDPDDTTGGNSNVTDPDDTTGGNSNVTDPDDTTGGNGNVTDPDNTTGGGNTQGGIRLHIGAGDESENTLVVYLPGITAAQLGIDNVDVSTTDGALAAIDVIKKGIEKLSSARADIGAYQNRLEYSVRNLDNIVENTTAAESQIRDTDMAKAMVEHSILNILQQSGQVVLAQANNSKEGILKLLE